MIGQYTQIGMFEQKVQGTDHLDIRASRNPYWHLRKEVKRIQLVTRRQLEER